MYLLYFISHIAEKNLKKWNQFLKNKIESKKLLLLIMHNFDHVIYTNTKYGHIIFIKSKNCPPILEKFFREKSNIEQIGKEKTTTFSDKKPKPNFTITHISLETPPNNSYKNPSITRKTSKNRKIL